MAKRRRTGRRKALPEGQWDQQFFAQLEQQTADFLAADRAGSTTVSYQQQCQQFDKFCERAGWQAATSSKRLAEQLAA